MVPTNLKTTMNSAGVIKLMQRQILCILKQRKANHVYTLSNVPTVKANIKQTQTYVLSRNIGSTKIDTRRNMLRSMRTGPNWFVQLWTMNLNYDLWQYKGFLSECLEEFTNYQYYPWDPIRFQYYFHLRASMVCHSHNTKHLKLQR